MENNIPDQLTRFEQAFQYYMDVYMTRRDLGLLEEMINEDFCGFGTGVDETVYNKKEGIKVFCRDITTAPNPLRYKLRRKEIKLLDQQNAIVNVQLDIATEIMGQELKLNNFRMMMVFHEREGLIKLAGLHVSFPTEIHEEGESYPLKELEDRAHVLSRMVEEKTKSLQEAYKELELIINTDSLTSLASRYFIEKAMVREWQRFNRFERGYSLIIMDLNDLKHINDNYGHKVGDEILKITGQTIKNQLRPTDIAGRWGGDEYLLLLPETGIPGAIKIAERIKGHMSLQKWPVKEEVNLSFGISTIRSGEDSEDLFCRVDAALYEAKNNKKDKIIARE